MKLKKILYIILGCIGLGLGAVGAVVPMLPAFPFLLLAAFCFARSSQKLHTWFINTRLYKENLESYVKDYAGGFIAIGGENSFALGNYKGNKQ